MYADILLMLYLILSMMLSTSLAFARSFEQKNQNFDSDPAWEGVRNRIDASIASTIIQDFGYRRTNYAGGKTSGEIGGRVSRSLTPATYAKVISTKTLDDRLTASGKFAVTQADGSSGVLMGWFNSKSHGWRTPNSLAFRLDGNGGDYWVFFEYGTQNRLTGGGVTFEGERYQTTLTPPQLADGTVHTWSLTYDSNGANGDGEITFVMDGTTYIAPLQPGHKTDNAVFDRFGIFNQQSSGKGMNVYLSNLMLDGKAQNFIRDPEWEGRGNHMIFEDREIRPYHNFGFSETNHAGGQRGEIGGLIWRIEADKPEQAGYYADRIGRLSMDDRLKASGKVSMTRAGVDSAVLIGWFNSETHIGAPPKNFIGIMVEGPSRVGHYFRPAYANAQGTHDAMKQGPLIQPNDEHHTWSLDYDPNAANGQGRITVTFNDEKTLLDLKPGVRVPNAHFNRFGILSYQRGGHFVDIYLDDISYTVEHTLFH